ncbi:protein kinase domain-containing protein [Streptosporangium sp. DT93]|uniref:serine/threonine-protein kinase n=1 Tax=Streptosporangium sp. DT93 TaxID=3393428 RepID=UPI003CF33309
MTDSQGIIGGRYRLLERIGRGGMGTVWRARDEVLGRDVAVKEVIPSPDLTGPEREVFTVRTLREARAAGRVGHPGVATVYDVIEEDGRPWIVMQLVDSRTLGAVVREDGPLPPMRVARIGLEVLSALVAAHHAGVLHRDVKPDNVLLARDGRAVLTDFGIAVLEGDSSITRTGSLIGTPAFIAPERAAGGPADFASDLWSLGVTLHVAVEGRSPFERAHPMATLSAVMHQEPEPLRLAGPLTPVILGLLRKDPAERMTAREVQAHLTALVNGTAPQPTMPIELPVEPPAEPFAGPLAGPALAASAAAATAPGGPPTVTVAGAPGAPGPWGTAGAVPPPVDPSGPTPPVASAPRRRRPVLLGAAAVAAAVALTSGGLVWVATNSAETPSKEPTTSASVPPSKKKPTGEAEQAKVPSGEDPSGGEDTSRPSRGTPRDEPSPRTPTGEPSSKPSAEPTQDDQQGPEDPADEPDQGQDQGGGDDGSGGDGGDGGGGGGGGGSGQDDAPGDDQQGDSPDQVDPASGIGALAPGGPGKAGRAAAGPGGPGKAGKAGKAAAGPVAVAKAPGVAKPAGGAKPAGVAKTRKPGKAGKVKV